MRVKREYMQRVKMELKSVGQMERKKEFLKKEIEILKKQDNYSKINFNKLGYKTYHSTSGIDDMIVNAEQEIFIKETEIEIIEKRLEMINLWIDELEEEEKEIIRLRYFTRKESVEKIARKLMCSKTNVYKKSDDAIRKIAMMKFSNEPIESILEK